MVSRKDFLAAVLPPLQDGEQYCTFGIKDDKVKQKFVSSIDELSEQSDVHVANAANSFFALAKYGDPKAGRITKNAVALKSFYIDLDCGSGKPFPDLNSGLAALKAFCKATNLPRPTIVKSGQGAHVYWILEEAVPRDVWKFHAAALKSLCEKHDFKVDPAVTCDAARVLRVPETMHVKDPTNPILVEVLYLAPLIPNDQLQTLFPSEESVLGVLDAGSGREEEFKRQMDATTLALIGNTQSIFKNILLKSIEDETPAAEGEKKKIRGCKQIAHIYTNQSTLEEPMWRAGLSIAHHCADRDKAIHAISKKHPDYTAEATERKAAETKGPYTCETFKKLNPVACEGCPHKFTSPIQIGREVIEAPDESVVEQIEHVTQELKTYTIPKFPFPFFRGLNGGLYIKTKTKDGEPTEEAVYPYDFYVVKRMHDPEHGETLLLRLHLPKDGVREFTMLLADVVSKERFIGLLAKQGMAVLNKKQDYLMSYVARWVEELQMTEEAEKAHRQFGLLEDSSAIIVGEREIRATEIRYNPACTATLPVMPLLHPKGDFHVWKDIINTYGREGMEARAFAFFMGFGTLLMKHTDLAGFMMNLVHPGSGTGKTTILKAINSIYGRPKELMLAPKDTGNMRWQRLGVLRNLCCTMDEVTNMPTDEISNCIYDATMGRAKGRMTRYGNAERQNFTEWRTGIITTSNRSMSDALLTMKASPDGELKRVLELEISPDPRNDPIWARNHFDRLQHNYGHAIQPYAQTLISQYPMVAEKFKEMQERVDRVAEVQNSERFWAMMVSISVCGGAIAKQLGLHDIPIKPVFDFGIETIKSARVRSREYMFNSSDFLGSFLQKNYSNTLVINAGKDARTGLDFKEIKEPRGPLTVRYEPDTKQLWVLARAYREDCVKAQVPYESSLAAYKKNGSFLGNKKKRMTAGTVVSTQAPVNALCFDTTKLEFFNDKIFSANEDTGDTATD